MIARQEPNSADDGDGRLLSRVLVVLSAVTLTAVALGGTVALARAGPGSDDGRADLALWACMEQRLRALVPSGATVVIDPSSDALAAQRLPEIAVPEYHVSATVVPGAFVLAARPAAAQRTSDDCGALRLTARRVS